MDRMKYHLPSLIAPENMSEAVSQLLRIEGNILTTDNEGYDCDMEGKSRDRRFLVVQHGVDQSTGWGLVQYLYVLDGHLIAVVWFGGDDLHHCSFTFNANETLLLVPPSNEANPCNQYVDAEFLVSTITEYWIAEKKA